MVKICTLPCNKWVHTNAKPTPIAIEKTGSSKALRLLNTSKIRSTMPIVEKVLIKVISLLELLAACVAKKKIPDWSISTL